MRRTAFIIVAAGRGVRMGAPLPKQYLPLEGRPILAHTVLAAAALLTPGDQLILVIPPDDNERVRTLLEEYCPGISLTLVHGGATRGESVLHGLREVSKEIELVAIHDGVRPILKRDMWDRLLAAMESGEAAIPVTRPTDSLRVITPDGDSIVLDRSLVRCVQTPQLFTRKAIVAAYEAEGDTTLTDDAGLYSRHSGRSPLLVEGDPDNLKITTPRDLALASLILRDEL
ncbi:2-C-methyl-D-erythritol 4-phosphate cytidylyltransferase [uncultured Porphyromonas sp.]|uniref:2-C-methyl-D-erythritol 4-phosphate cytidylyltransferase n=1 Tax=uncultured Porphyromonas sp. TaxID=159274 RepID=UPI0026109119|nr:2-C-methyl-D-erythritol 4-phosphate cytidylyltransferase [uncultured Porphyromonas sp.]